ncbi:histidinol-phosphatase [Parabacteroides sp. FAFU027]|uniref:histidinol-phosphatase n=1 Tax=Parabacteroides sp. FAFU027 TaxID=2922715 RepID=UPI001FAF6EB5|nr:histidinol-phosphatase [Parabacteroides sp. FAFU027]
MYLSNYHSHCTFCDGRSYPEDFVKFAISKGVKSYGFTSHAPLPFETFWTMKHDDVNEYFQEITRLKEKYGDRIELYCGLETDYLNEEHHAGIDYFANLPYDYLISSIHYISHPVTGELMGIDGPYSEFEEAVNRVFRGSIEDVIRSFLVQSMKMVKTGGFHIVGHVDKIYMNGGKFPGFYDHQALIDELMDKLLLEIQKKNLILEINTKSLLSQQMTFPNQRYFNRILELNIPVTINCDSHYPHHVLQGKAEAVGLLKSLGLTHTMELKKGAWEVHKL